MKWEYFGTGLAFIGIGITLALALPPPWWLKMPPHLVRIGLFVGLALIIYGVAITAMGIWPEELRPRLWPILAMASGLFIFVAGSIWYWKTESGEHDGPLAIRGLILPYDYVDGTKSDGITWYAGYSRVEIILENPLAEAILDVDATFQPELPIIQSVAISDFAKCDIRPIGPPFSIAVTDGKSKVVAGDAGPPVIVAPSHRLYCEKLTAKTSVRAILATVVIADIQKPGSIFEKEGRKPTFIDIQIKYHVGEKKYEKLLRLAP